MTDTPLNSFSRLNDQTWMLNNLGTFYNNSISYDDQLKMLNLFSGYTQIVAAYYAELYNTDFSKSLSDIPIARQELSNKINILYNLEMDYLPLFTYYGLSSEKFVYSSDPQGLDCSLDIKGSWDRSLIPLRGPLNQNCNLYFESKIVTDGVSSGLIGYFNSYSTDLTNTLALGWIQDRYIALACDSENLYTAVSTECLGVSGGTYTLTATYMVSGGMTVSRYDESGSYLDSISLDVPIKRFPYTVSNYPSILDNSNELNADCTDFTSTGWTSTNLTISDKSYTDPFGGMSSAQLSSIDDPTTTACLSCDSKSAPGRTQFSYGIWVKKGAPTGESQTIAIHTMYASSLYDIQMFTLTSDDWEWIEFTCNTNLSANFTTPLTMELYPDALGLSTGYSLYIFSPFLWYTLRPNAAGTQPMEFEFDSFGIGNLNNLNHIDSFINYYDSMTGDTLISRFAYVDPTLPQRVQRVDGLQSELDDPIVTLTCGSDTVSGDYYIDEQTMCFIDTIPSVYLWAPVWYVDNPGISDNFGSLVRYTISEDTHTDQTYLNGVAGLWYAFFMGPTVHNLAVGLSILAGEPFAEKSGEVSTIADLDASWGYIAITPDDGSKILTYEYRKSLGIAINPATNVEYTVGDTIDRFAPLSNALSVVDYVNEPNWYRYHLLNETGENKDYTIQKYSSCGVRLKPLLLTANALSIMAGNFLNQSMPAGAHAWFMREDDTPLFVVDDYTYQNYLNATIVGDQNILLPADFIYSDSTEPYVYGLQDLSGLDDTHKESPPMPTNCILNVDLPPVSYLPSYSYTYTSRSASTLGSLVYIYGQAAFVSSDDGVSWTRVIEGSSPNPATLDIGPNIFADYVPIELLGTTYNIAFLVGLNSTYITPSVIFMNRLYESPTPFGTPLEIYQSDDIVPACIKKGDFSASISGSTPIGNGTFLAVGAHSTDVTELICYKGEVDVPLEEAWPGATGSTGTMQFGSLVNPRLGQNIILADAAPNGIQIEVQLATKGTINPSDVIKVGIYEGQDNATNLVEEMILCYGSEISAVPEPKSCTSTTAMAAGTYSILLSHTEANELNNYYNVVSGAALWGYPGSPYPYDVAYMTDAGEISVTDSSTQEVFYPVASSTTAYCCQEFLLDRRMVGDLVVKVKLAVSADFTPVGGPLEPLYVHLYSGGYNEPRTFVKSSDGAISYLDLSTTPTEFTLTLENNGVYLDPGRYTLILDGGAEISAGSFLVSCSSSNQYEDGRAFTVLNGEDTLIDKDWYFEIALPAGNAPYTGLNITTKSYLNFPDDYITITEQSTISVGESVLENFQPCMDIVWVSGTSWKLLCPRANSNEIYVFDTTDDGVTWSRSIAEITTVPETIRQSRLFWDSNDTLYYYYKSSAGEDYVVASRDEGLTWSVPVHISTDYLFREGIYPSFVESSGIVRLIGTSVTGYIVTYELHAS